MPEYIIGIVRTRSPRPGARGEAGEEDTKWSLGRPSGEVGDFVGEDNAESARNVGEANILMGLDIVLGESVGAFVSLDVLRVASAAHFAQLIPTVPCVSKMKSKY